MRILRTALLTVVGGLLIAFALYYLTTPPFRVIVGGPNLVTTQAGHTDFWTGEITPRILTQYGEDLQVQSVYVDPEEYTNYRVIPLPVGFAVGSLLTLTVITLASRKSRRTSPNPVVPAA